MKHQAYGLAYFRGGFDEWADWFGRSARLGWDGEFMVLEGGGREKRWCS